MNYYCTLSDKKYLLQGLVLYNSLCKHDPDFRLIWLCLDEETYEYLSNADIDKIFPLSLAELECNDKELRQAKNNPPSKYGTQYSQYCWALTPYMMDFILRNKFVPKDEFITYIDSDICFYHSPQLILDVIGSHSIGIHSHRYASAYSPLTNPAGEFNVGVVAIRNNETGRSCAEWWKNCLLNPTHRYYEIYGTCGDQKYLDLFQPLFGDVCVFDRPAPGRPGIGYLAPWCVDNVTYYDNRNIVYQGTEQKMVFCHFSHFNYDLRTEQYRDSNNGEWRPTQFRPVKQYYDEYFLQIKHLSQTLTVPLSNSPIQK